MKNNFWCSVFASRKIRCLIKLAQSLFVSMRFEKCSFSFATNGEMHSIERCASSRKREGEKERKKEKKWRGKKNDEPCKLFETNKFHRIRTERCRASDKWRDAFMFFVPLIGSYNGQQPNRTVPEHGHDTVHRLTNRKTNDKYLIIHMHTNIYVPFVRIFPITCNSAHRQQWANRSAIQWQQQHNDNNDCYSNSGANEYKFNYVDVKLIEWNLATICVFIWLIR